MANIALRYNDCRRKAISAEQSIPPYDLYGSVSILGKCMCFAPHYALYMEKSKQQLQISVWLAAVTSGSGVTRHKMGRPSRSLIALSCNLH